MSIIEEFVENLERSEKDSEMYFSIYYVPESYQPDEDSYP